MHKKVRCGLKAAREWHIDRPAWLALEECTACRRHDPDHFNRFARFDISLAPLTNAHVIAAVAFRAWCVVIGILKALTEGIAVRPKVFRQRFIDDRDRHPLALRRFAPGESAAT